MSVCMYGCMAMLSDNVQPLHDLGEKNGAYIQNWLSQTSVTSKQSQNMAEMCENKDEIRNFLTPN